MAEPERTIHLVRPGRTEYRTCWELQRQLLDLRSGGAIGDVLLLTEHDHVYTIGRTGSEDHLLANGAEREALGADFVYTDRGGDITYHGPGQIVGYPILDLTAYGRDLHHYLRDLEEVAIRTLARVGIVATRIQGYTGVWVDDEKICAIGVKTIRWITMHGFALNVSTDLKYFGRIIPCGIFEKGVTSVEAVLGKSVDTEDVVSILIREFGDVFGAKMLSGPMPELRGMEHAAPLREKIHKGETHAW